MKNPHGVEPTRFMKRKESMYATCCRTKYGPTFGDNDIYISDNCNIPNSCIICNDGTRRFECHPELKSSLFLNSFGPDEPNYFNVLDYEVFTLDYQSRYTINHICKYPDIIWEYIQTNDISKNILKYVDNELDLLNDLNMIQCNNKAIRMKILTRSLNNPSEYLPNTHIVSKQYDSYLKEWLGKHSKWGLLYRASEHDYTAKSFHEHCDEKGPTLVIIKSSGGCIFGGYTTQSWSGDSIYDY